MEILDMIKKASLDMESEAIALLGKLTSENTTDYNEKNGQAVVEEYLSGMRCKLTRIYPDPSVLKKYKEFNQGHTYEDRYCVVAEFPGDGSGKSIILNAHIDTVPPASPREWMTDPFSPTLHDGKLYALGAADDKGGLCAMLMSLKLLEKIGIKRKGDVIFQSVVDEEAGGGNGTLAVIDAGYKADAVLVAEPNTLVPCSAQIGSYALKIVIQGKSAHGNMKHKGVSAFEKALPLINRLSLLEKKWSTRHFPLLNNQYLSILQITAGDGSITLPNQCEMLVNFTYFPDDYDYIGEIEEIIKICEDEDPWFVDHPIKTEIHHNCGSYYNDPQSEWPSLVSKCISDIKGIDVAVQGFPTGADSRLYANVGKMPCVVLGPGSIEVCHKPNEFIKISDLMQAVESYAYIIYRWCC